MSTGQKDTLDAMKSKQNNEEDSIPMEVREDIAKNLAYYMSKAGEDRKKSRQLGPLAGVSYKTIDRILRPRVYPTGATLGRLYRIAKALDIDTYQLLVPARRAAATLLSGQERRTEEKPFNSDRSDKRNELRKDKKSGKS